MKIEVGMKFRHARILEEDYKTNAEYIITKIAKGCVYYKQLDEVKAKEYDTIEHFPKIVLNKILYK